MVYHEDLCSTKDSNDFIICLGYKGHIIKEYFINYFYTTQTTVELGTNKLENTLHQFRILQSDPVDTGLNTADEQAESYQELCWEW